MLLMSAPLRVWVGLVTFGMSVTGKNDPVRQQLFSATALETAPARRRQFLFTPS